ncbi:hypothetical protein V8F20_007032, partial [Naviculisporaceae sp. PSN 640]
WTSAEKELLFESLSRYSSHDTAAIAFRIQSKARFDTAEIAARIQTKTRFEVADYIKMLESSLKRQKWLSAGEDLGDIRITMADIPAAMEISEPCCDALEAAADELARKQALDEEKVERERWGKTPWLIDESTLSKFAKSGTVGTTKPGLSNALELFRVDNWLELSERVFMNTSPCPSCTFISDTEEEEGTEIAPEHEGPGIHAAALEEFYSIVVALTRRILKSTVFMAQARSAGRGGQIKVEKRSVEAAISSLGLPGRNWEGERRRYRREIFWAGAARRLGLEVYEGDMDSLPPFSDVGAAGESEEESESEGHSSASAPMSYDEVERSLGLNMVEGREGEQNVPSSPSSSSSSSEISEEEDDEEEESPFQHEREQVENEVDEFVEAIRPRVIGGHVKELMRKRVRAARAQEEYADRMDLKASRQEEKRLWALLGEQEETVDEDIDTDGRDGGDGEIVNAEEEEEILNRTDVGTVEELYEYWTADGQGVGGSANGPGDIRGWRHIVDEEEGVELEEEEDEDVELEDEEEEGVELDDEEAPEGVPEEAIEMA